jgi:hypothetical protein
MIAASGGRGITGALQLGRPGEGWYAAAMCRSIRTLRDADVPATTGEVEAAARQYVRKVSGFRQPSARNAAAFEAAIAEITAASERLIRAVGGSVEPGADRRPPVPSSRAHRGDGPAGATAEAAAAGA